MANAAQQSAHGMLGTAALRRAARFAWLRIFSTPRQSPRPPQRQYQPVNLLFAQDAKKEKSELLRFIFAVLYFN